VPGQDLQNGSASGAGGRNLLSRLNLGHVVMLLAAISALVLNLAILRGNDATIEVAVAATDVRVGTSLTEGHLAFAEVPADDVLSSRLIPSDRAGQLVGQLATRSIADGEPILESDLLAVDNRDGLRAMSIPIEESRAVSGRLSSGDSVDIVLVQDGIATYVATGIKVLDVPSSETNALGARTGYSPTVAVNATEALRIAAALDTGEVHIIRSTGAALPDLEQASAIEPIEEEQTG